MNQLLKRFEKSIIKTFPPNNLVSRLCMTHIRLFCTFWTFFKVHSGFFNNLTGNAGISTHSYTLSAGMPVLRSAPKNPWMSQVKTGNKIRRSASNGIPEFQARFGVSVCGWNGCLLTIVLESLPDKIGAQHTFIHTPRRSAISEVKLPKFSECSFRLCVSCM